MPRTQIGYGPNGPFTTYYMDTPPTPIEFDLKGDRWFDTYSQNLFVWDGEEWLADESLQIQPIQQDELDLTVDPRDKYLDDLTSQFTQPITEMPPPSQETKIPHRQQPSRLQ